MLKIVGMGDFAVSADPELSLVTYALGTCVGLSAHDAKSGAGGLLHFMLPESSLNPARAAAQPGMFADSGLEAMLAALGALGASPRRLVLKLAGASDGVEAGGFFDIGRRNLLACRRLLFFRGLGLSAEESGGRRVRSLRLEIGSGRCLLKSTPASDRDGTTEKPWHSTF